MANIKISELPQASVLSQNSVLPVVSGSTTYKVNLEDLNIIEKTKAQIDTLVGSNSLIPGQLYKITGVDTALYGGTDILIKAATTDKLELAGHGIFYNPKYINSSATPNNGYGIWKSINTYSIGNNVIWGGKHWTNKTGNTGTSVDKYTLNSTNWDVVPFNNINYNVVADIIHYDQQNNLIIRRKDKYDNDVDGNVQFFTEVSSPDGYGLGNPIKNFQWGNGQEDFNTNDYVYTGVQGNYVKDSYLECINFTGGDLWYNTLTEGSYIGNNTITDNNSTISNNTLSNGGSIDDNIFNSSCNITNNILDNSGIDVNTLTNSNITRNKLYVDSIIGYNTLISSSRIEYNDLYDNAFITSNTLSNTTNGYLNGYITDISKNKLVHSRIESNTITENSKIESNILSNLSQINTNTLVASVMSTNTLSQGSQLNENALTASSNINTNTLTGGSYINTNIMTGSSVNTNTLSGVSYIRTSTLSGNSSINNNTLNNSSTFNFSSSGTLTSKTIAYIEASYANAAFNISAATIIFTQTYSKQMFRNSAGTTRLGYYNNSDVFTVVNVNA